MQRFTIDGNIPVQVDFEHKWRFKPVKERVSKREQKSIEQQILEYAVNKQDRINAHEIEEIIQNQPIGCATEKKPYMTICTLTIGEQVFSGTSICHKNDNFSKVKGRKVSFANALKQTHPNLGDGLDNLLSKQQRRQLFFEVFPKYWKYDKENRKVSEELCAYLDAEAEKIRESYVEFEDRVKNAIDEHYWFDEEISFWQRVKNEINDCWADFKKTIGV